MSENHGSIDNIAVGKRIKAIRDARHMTQEQMAECLKITPNAIRDYEKGNYGISKDVMLLLKQQFSVSMDYLLFGELPEEENILLLLKNSSEECKLKILMYLWSYFTRNKEIKTFKDMDLKRIQEV